VRNLGHVYHRCGTTRPARTPLRGHRFEQLPDVGHLARHRGGRDHRRAHEECPARRTALAPLEIPVRRGRADLTAFQAIRIHRQAHRAAGAAPFEAGFDKYLVQPFGLRRGLDRHRSRHRQRRNTFGHLASAHDCRRGLQIRQAAVGAGTDFNRLKPHIQNSETAYLRPLLGPGLFKELQDFYNDPDADPPVENKILLPELLSLTQRSLIHLTYWSGFQVLNATISDGGFKRTENEKVKSLFKYQEVELKEYFKTTGFNGLDEILFYLETEIGKSTEETVHFKRECADQRSQRC